MIGQPSSISTAKKHADLRNMQYMATHLHFEHNHGKTTNSHESKVNANILFVPSDRVKMYCMYIRLRLRQPRSGIIPELQTARRKSKHICTGQNKHKYDVKMRPQEPL